MDDRLQRRARDAAAGDPAAGARLLVERRRAGELTDDRLQLAALLGDEAARLALAPAAPEDLPEDDLERWTLGIAACGRETAVRAAHVATRAAAATVTLDLADRSRIEPLLAAVDLWLACVCHTHARAALALAPHANRARSTLKLISGLRRFEGDDPGWVEEARREAVVTMAQVTVSLVAEPDRARRPIVDGAWKHEHESTLAILVGRAAGVAAEGGAVEWAEAVRRVREPVRESLLAWALG